MTTNQLILQNAKLKAAIAAAAERIADVAVSLPITCTEQVKTLNDAKWQLIKATR